MPIAADEVPKLIKEAQIKKLESWKADYFERVASALQVHTKGQLFAKVDTLFPHEHPDSKAHCIATYEPITKASIWKGINNVKRIFSSSSFSINVGEQLQKWLNEYEHEGENVLNYFLTEWVSKAIAEDPNGLFVIYPPEYAQEKDVCPIQFVRSSLIKAKGRDFVAFVSEVESEKDYQFISTVTCREVFPDPKLDGNLNARTNTKTTYNQRLDVQIKKEVVHLFTKEGFIIYSQGDQNKANYQVINFSDPLSQIPVFAAGGTVSDNAQEKLYESFVQPFVPFGNLALIQHRNHRAVDLQFSYPRMSELQLPCDYQGCNGGQINCDISINPEGHRDCPQCNGAGYVTVQSPYKVYRMRYDPNDANDNKHLAQDPVRFHSPDVGIINYSKDAWKNYLKLAEESIFVMQKVYTGQVESAESKEMDLDELYAWLLNIAKVFYNNLRMVLQCLEEYISRNPTTVSVEQPYSFAILTEGEAFVALNNILMSQAPIFVKANRVENFVNKFVSKDSPVNRALEVLKQYDPLLFYSNGEVQSFKGQNVITQEMYVKHVLGYPMFLKLYIEDKNIVFETDEVIITKLDAEIKEVGPPNAETIRQNILKQVTQPAA